MESTRLLKVVCLYESSKHGKHGFSVYLESLLIKIYVKKMLRVKFFSSTAIGFH